MSKKETSKSQVLDTGGALFAVSKPPIHKRIFKQLSGMGFMLPFIIAFLLFFIIPFVSGVAQSFLDKKGQFVGLQNFFNIFFNKELIYREQFLRGLGNTLLYVCISVPCLIIIPFLIALLLDMEPPGYKLFRAILFMPTIFSITSVILMWKRILEVETGFINSFFLKFNLSQIDFLGSQPWAWISILIVTIWWTMGTNMVILGAGLKNIDKAMYEAAAIDGASGVKTVVYITLPSIIGQLIVVGIMTILASFNLYGQAQLLTGGGPERSTEVLLMVIMRYLYDRPQIASAMSLALGSIMIVISLAQAGIMKLREGK